ncbi:MAG TPA: NUDIX domain-containing protein [Fimbriimonadaceae bacterium]|nr:NUDIX domain-containing protein [Fimbriimonadaceae bacterium]HRJ33959.1 NUDIX domain-containing protein [Fimbriimonadaceae bacterium]
MTGKYPGLAEKYFRISAYAVIVQEGQVLLCRLSREVRDSPGSWTLPGGGCHFGEDPLETVVRETHEETGYQIRVLRPLTVTSDHYRNSDHEVHVVRLIFEAEIVSGELRPEPFGSTDLAQWIPLASLDQWPLVATALAGLAGVLKEIA